ncbi:hypothetical protein M422DRAFT_274984 [Sphaerobolus stellatus SS14]|uniref:Uncharacterized protein n=1 Tax=Sphaerobolus stellatus (strain SS14) TaxID=990650 RepID=A0A0C9UFM9_SPHS4|nr:hypothetical protein M422DRAFT_274984 [Sphaerobolus stellatus SS14]
MSQASSSNNTADLLSCFHNQKAKHEGPHIEVRAIPSACFVYHPTGCDQCLGYVEHLLVDMENCPSKFSFTRDETLDHLQEAWPKLGQYITDIGDEHDAAEKELAEEKQDQGPGDSNHKSPNNSTNIGPHPLASPETWTNFTASISRVHQEIGTQHLAPDLYPLKSHPPQFHPRIMSATTSSSKTTTANTILYKRSKDVPRLSTVEKSDPCRTLSGFKAISEFTKRQDLTKNEEWEGYEDAEREVLVQGYWCAYDQEHDELDALYLDLVRKEAVSRPDPDIHFGLRYIIHL